MAGQEPELFVEGVGGVLEEAEAVDGGAMDGGEVGVVGLVAGVGGLAELLGGEGMDDADLEPGVAEGGQDRGVEPPGAFDGDDHGPEPVGLRGLADGPDGRLEAGAIVREGGGWDEDFPVEIGEEELGAGLGAIDADDPKAFGAYGLHPGMQCAGGLVDLVWATTTPGCGTRCHE